MDDRRGIVAKIVLEHALRSDDAQRLSSADGRRSSEWLDRRDLDGFLHRSWLKSSGVERRRVPRPAR